MLKLTEYEDYKLNKFYLQQLKQKRFVALNKEGKLVYIGLYNTTALVKMVKYCYTMGPEKQRNRQPYPIAAVISKIVYWYDWSIENAKHAKYAGEFYKSLNAWQDELEVSRSDIDSAEEFLKEIGALRTEIRSLSNMRVKYWILDRKRLDRAVQLFLSSTLIVQNAQEPPNDSEIQWFHFFQMIRPEVLSLAEESTFFMQGLININFLDSPENQQNEGNMVPPHLRCNADPSALQSRPICVVTQTHLRCNADIEEYNRIIDKNNKSEKEDYQLKLIRTNFHDLPLTGDDLKDSTHRRLGVNTPSSDEEEASTQSGQAVQEDAPVGPPPELDALFSVSEAGRLNPSLPMKDSYHPEKGNQFPTASQEEIGVNSEYNILENSERSISQDEDEEIIPREPPTEPPQGVYPSFGTHLSPKPRKALRKPLKGVHVSPEEAKYLSVVEMWNAIPPIPKIPVLENKGLTHHTFDNSGVVSKTVKQILERLVLIGNGEFYKTNPSIATWNKVSLNDDWLNASIPIHGFAEIFKVYREYFEPGKGVSDKSQLKLSLLEFLGCYTIHTRYNQDRVFEPRSWFWEVLHRGNEVPSVINYEVYEERVKNTYSSIENQLKSVLSDSTAPRSNWDVRIKKITARLLYTYEAVYKNTYMLYKHTDKEPAWIELMGSFENFVRIFTEYIHTFGFKDLQPGHFDPSKKMFQNFLAYGKEREGVILNPDKETARTLLQQRCSVRYSAEDVARDNGGKPLWYSFEEMNLVTTKKVNPWWDMESLFS